jgi:eukaryotic translation initiation factor 2C
MDRKYKVVINHATAISLLQLRMLLAGYPTDIPAQVLQVLETVLGDVLFNERNDIE